MWFGVQSPDLWSKTLVGGGHAVLAALLLQKSRAVNLMKRSELTSHYMFIWKLFYAEYLLIPFFR
jgi:homogentisate phytyltransferase/homogentisate geranylgeranyltransferase